MFRVLPLSTTNHTMSVGSIGMFEDTFIMQSCIYNLIDITQNEVASVADGHIPGAELKDLSTLPIAHL